MAASARDGEAALPEWVKPPSDYAETKCERTETEIKERSRASAELAAAPLKVYAKDSYADKTNVRLDYDVDTAVECTEFYYYGSRSQSA